MSSEGSTGSAGAAPDSSRPSGVAITIAPATILVFVGLVALTWSLVKVGGTLLIIFVSIFLAIVLAPVVEVTARRLNLGRGAASTLVVLGLSGVVVLLLLIVAAPLIDAVRSFADNLPELTQRIDDSAIGRQLNIRDELSGVLEKNAPAIASGAGSIAGGVVGFAASAFGVFVATFSLVFMTLFLVKDLPSYKRGLLSLLSGPSAGRWSGIWDDIVTSTSRYMIGNIVISLICAVTYGVTALLLGLPYALALAVIAGILDLIPNIGAFVAGVIIGAVALTVSTTAVVVFVIVILVYQQIENYILQPTIIGKAADLSGFLVIVSVLFWGAIFGVVGAIVGVPVTAAILIIVRALTADRRARNAAESGSDPGAARP
jgi:predicted PurR-regulated permease PerM